MSDIVWLYVIVGTIITALVTSVITGIITVAALALRHMPRR